MELLHIGIPSSKRGENDTYIADLKLAVSNPDEHPYHWEYISFDEDSPVPEIMKTRYHISYEVPDVASELAKCQEVVLPVHDIGPEILAFGLMDGVLVELIHTK